jgi:hypothetical protein
MIIMIMQQIISGVHSGSSTCLPGLNVLISQDMSCYKCKDRFTLNGILCVFHAGAKVPFLSRFLLFAADSRRRSSDTGTNLLQDCTALRYSQRTSSNSETQIFSQECGCASATIFGKPRQSVTRNPSAIWRTCEGLERNFAAIHRPGRDFWSHWNTRTSSERFVFVAFGLTTAQFSLIISARY